MKVGKKMQVNYVTSSPFKAEENQVFVSQACLDDGVPVNKLFSFRIRKVPIPEILEVDLRVMVQAEVTRAYSQIKVPCIVEHAGLIFEEHEKHHYPGGLTKPMWNALGDKFLIETHSANRRVIARAVVAYCDGMSVLTFVGETRGTLADAPRGKRAFYWDTVFIPDELNGGPGSLTNAEIVETPKLGIEHKVLKLSQSSKAMLAFLKHIREVGLPRLWS